MVRFFGVQELVRLLWTVGVEEFLSNLIRYTRDDYLRWPKFEKSPRLASHSANRVIELMPIDGAAHGGHLGARRSEPDSPWKRCDGIDWPRGLMRSRRHTCATGRLL